jgi:hypothetical protein
VDGVALFSRSNANNTQAPLVPAKPDGTVVADAKAPGTPAKSGHAFNNGGDVATVEKAGDDPWLTREIAKLSPAEAQRTLSAVGEIITHQQSMTDAAFKTWLAQNSTLLALYNHYLADPGHDSANFRPVSSDKLQTWFFADRDPYSLLEALQDRSALGELSDTDKEKLLDFALSNFSHFAFEQIEQLATLVQEDTKVDAGVRWMVAEALLKRAADPGGDAYNPAAEARAYALYFVRAMQGGDPHDLADMIAELEPKQASGFLRALNGGHLADTRLANGRTPGWHDDHHLKEGLTPDERLNNQHLLTWARDHILASIPSLTPVGLRTFRGCSAGARQRMPWAVALLLVLSARRRPSLRQTSLCHTSAHPVQRKAPQAPAHRKQPGPNPSRRKRKNARPRRQNQRSKRPTRGQPNVRPSSVKSRS